MKTMQSKYSMKVKYEKAFPFQEIKVNRMHKRYLDAEVSLKMNWRSATCWIDGRYIMLNGTPIGELGWKWWICKVINKVRTREKKMMERSI